MTNAFFMMELWSILKIILIFAGLYFVMKILLRQESTNNMPEMYILKRGKIPHSINVDMEVGPEEYNRILSELTELEDSLQGPQIMYFNTNIRIKQEQDLNENTRYDPAVVADILNEIAGSDLDDTPDANDNDTI